jgi:hypothetical protein
MLLKHQSFQNAQTRKENVMTQDQAQDQDQDITCPFKSRNHLPYFSGESERRDTTSGGLPALSTPGLIDQFRHLNGRVIFPFFP